MRTLLGCSCLLWLLGAAMAADLEVSSPRIGALRESARGENRSLVVKAFWDEVRQARTPLVEPSGENGWSLVTFLWQGDDQTRNVVVLGGVAGIDPARSLLTHLDGTDVWYRTYKVRNDARFTYSMSPNDSLESFDKIDPKDMAGIMRRIASLRVDPLNPHQFRGGMPSSTVELPGAPAQRWIVEDKTIPHGNLMAPVKFRSRILKNERDLWIYTPPGYDPQAARYPLVVVFDGLTYVSIVPTPVILDNLIAARRIPPVVAVIVGNATATSRSTELPCSAAFADFLAEELVPMMREKYRATMDPVLTVVGGSSYGGLAAMYAGLRHPGVFGRILAQSGSYWWKPDGDSEHEWLTRQFVQSDFRPAQRFFLEVGLMEDGPTPGAGPSMVVTNRHMRDVLRARGYPLHYSEFNGGHEYLNWRGSFADGLLYLLGSSE